LVRIRFGEASDAEQRSLAELDQRVDELFQAALAATRSATWWRTAVREVSPELDAERLDDGTIVVRPRVRASTPLAERVVAAAPRGLSVVNRRPPRSFADAVSRAKQRGLDYASASARAGFARGHLLEVVVKRPGSSADEREQAAAEELVWELLGERRADDWIGAVSAAPAPRGGPLRVVAAPEPASFPLSELPAAAAAAIEGLYAGMPPLPLCSLDSPLDWTMFELNPEPADDFSADDDLVLVSTCVPELIKCHLEKAPFSSLRFSRHGETFLYLKYAARGGPETRLSTRRQLEDQIDEALMPARLGRVVGGGLGLRYSYVYLALTACERALDVITTIGVQARVPTRSWVLPLDSDLAHEWCGIWPATPAPP
jgi:hypothetical protein